jgi:hypothetical protein
MKFVYKARKSKIPHKYDSMAKLLGAVQTKSNKKTRQIGDYYVARCLLENKRNQRLKDVLEALECEGIGKGTVEGILARWNKAGIISYESPLKNIDGHKQRGLFTYSLSEKSHQEISFEEIYEQVRMKRKNFYSRKNLFKVFSFIEQNPDVQYEGRSLAEKLKMRHADASQCLSVLEEIEYLTSASGFKGRYIESKIAPNDLLKMLYDLVLEPAYIIAHTLNPGSIEAERFDPKYAEEFLKNFWEERYL